MAKTYFTLTGTKYFLGNDFLKAGMKLTLEKEPDNKYDKEAILVKRQGIAIGHVANSVHTVLGDSMSAGRIYDKFGEKAKAKVVLVTEHGTICKLCKKQASGIKKNKIDYDEELSFK